MSGAHSYEEGEREANKRETFISSKRVVNQRAILIPFRMPGSFRRKGGISSRQGYKVSTRGDKFERHVCTSVDSYFLYNVENNPPPSLALLAINGREAWTLRPEPLHPSDP